MAQAKVAAKGSRDRKTAAKAVTKGPAKRAAVRSAGPRLVISDGERITESVELIAFDETNVIVDRDELRALRLTEAAQTVFDAAKGAEAVTEIRKKHGGPDHVHRVNPYDLHLEPDHNPRVFTSPARRLRVAELTRSVAVEGVTTPLDCYVKNGMIFINGGETRWRAVLHALNFLNKRIDRIKIIIAMGENASDRFAAQYIGNDQEPFDPLEAGTLFRNWRKFGDDPVDIARRIGKVLPNGSPNTAFVIDRIKLLEMPDWLQHQVRAGHIKADTAYKDIWLSSQEDDKKAKKLLAGAVDIANDAEARRVMPKHIRQAGGTRIIATVASITNDLAVILKDREREEDGGLRLDAEAADRLFKLAKLDRPVEAPAESQ